jgi:hypothetical protein
MGEGFRWVAVKHPSRPELQVTLMTPGPPLDPEMADMVRRQLEKGQMGGLGLAVNDCHKTFEELSAKGVTFIQEPADHPYGIEAVMRDNSGNWLVLVEARPSARKISAETNVDAGPGLPRPRNVPPQRTLSQRAGPARWDCRPDRLSTPRPPAEDRDRAHGRC